MSDFFVPNLGGVEMHIYNVAQSLMGRGHKVIVITRAFSGERRGIRYLSNGLKVYHVPSVDFVGNNTFGDGFFFRLPVYRNIFIRERI